MWTIKAKKVRMTDPRVAEAIAFIKQQGAALMTVVSDFIAAQTAHNARIATAVSGISGDIGRMQADIADLKTKLVSSEEVAGLAALSETADRVAASLEALDALTPPPAPPVVEEPVA